MGQPHRTVATVLLSIAFVIGFSIWFIEKYFWLDAQSLIVRLWPPPTTGQVEHKQLRQIAGWLSLDCGHVRYREDADGAITCARDALRARRPFYVAFDVRGIDSHGTTGLAANSEGTVYQVETDQLTGGWAGYVPNSGQVRTPTVIRCTKAPGEVTVLPANRFLSCVADSTPE